MAKKVILLFIFVLGLGSLSFADTIYLKNGNKIQGTIVQQTNTMVKINISGVAITYYMDEIERIEQDQAAADSVPPSPASPERAAPQVIPSPSPAPRTPAVVDSKPSPDLVLRYLDLSGTSATLDQMFQEMIANSSPQDSQMLQQAYDLQEVLEILVPVYQKHFSQDDLQKLVAFYQSPVAVKLNRVMPNLVKDTLDAAMLYFRTKLPSQGPSG